MMEEKFMKVIKCDRCGKIFNNPNPNSNVNLDNYRNRVAVMRIDSIVPHSVVDVDLCDECNKQLYDWIFCHACSEF